MNVEEVRKFLTETEEGKALAEEIKAPLLSKRDELLQENKRLGEKLTAETQRADDTEKLHKEDRAALHETIVDGTLDELMSKYNVLPQARESVRSAIKGRENITLEKSDGGRRVATVKTEDGKSVPLEDYMHSWKETDEAKLYIRAGNSGGGAQGNSKPDPGPSEADTWKQRLQSAMGVSTE